MNWDGSDMTLSAYSYTVIFGLVNGAGDDFFTLTSIIHSNSMLDHIYKLFSHRNRVDRAQGKTYEQRLQLMNITTLERRRQRGDLIEVYKILTGKEDMDPTT